MGEPRQEQDGLPQHTTIPLSDDDKFSARHSQQRGELRSKYSSLRIRKAQAAAKRKAEKRRESEGAGGSEGSPKRRKEKSDHIPCPTPLRTIEAVTSDVSRGEKSSFTLHRHKGDKLLEFLRMTLLIPPQTPNLIGDTTEWVVIGTKSIPPAATRPDTGKSIAQEETPMPDPLPKGAGADEAGSSLPPSLFVPSWGIHQRSRVTTSEECRDLMVNLIPPGVREVALNLLDNNIVLDRAWFSLARGAYAQPYSLLSIESLYDSPIMPCKRVSRPRCPSARSDPRGFQCCSKFLGRKLFARSMTQCSEGPFAAVASRKTGKSGMLNKDFCLVNAETYFQTRNWSSSVLRRASEKEQPWSNNDEGMRTVQDLLKLNPAPSPRDAPKAGSGGINGRLLLLHLFLPASLRFNKLGISISDPGCTAFNFHRGEFISLDLESGAPPFGMLILPTCSIVCDNYPWETEPANDVVHDKADYLFTSPTVRASFLSNGLIPSSKIVLDMGNLILGGVAGKGLWSASLKFRLPRLSSLQYVPSMEINQLEESNLHPLWTAHLHLFLQSLLGPISTEPPPEPFRLGTPQFREECPDYSVSSTQVATNIGHSRKYYHLLPSPSRKSSRTGNSTSGLGLYGDPVRSTHNLTGHCLSFRSVRHTAETASFAHIASMHTCLLREGGAKEEGILSANIHC
ncbi:hypothetical protein Tco_0704265 [Tanacetum coccineum]|uniref:Uncharacterized protein n=1 Tax=Tanacetum coccineum TaxID=301880 RepID=A0ABQ4Y161_9ASTR